MEVMRRAAAMVQRAGRGEVGTEHLLAAMVLDPGSRARRVLNHLAVSAAAIKEGLGGYVGPGKQRRRRRGKADLARSFAERARRGSKSS
jgi:ATP-dependent Clp protease ATP-binding subunit ClpA